MFFLDRFNEFFIFVMQNQKIVKIVNALMFVFFKIRHVLKTILTLIIFFLLITAWALICNSAY